MRVMLLLAQLALAPIDEVVVSVPGRPIVWAIGLSCDAKPLGVYLIRSDGVPRWVPVESADSGDTSTVKRLAAAGQLSARDVCR
jgi:hypothetical protein